MNEYDFIKNRRLLQMYKKMTAVKKDDDASESNSFRDGSDSISMNADASTLVAPPRAKN